MASSSTGWMTAREAQDYLGISNRKLAQLLKRGVLPFEGSALDKRLKLIKCEDVERLRGQRRGAKSVPKAAAAVA